MEPYLLESQRQTYVEALEALNAEGVPYVLAGAFALQRYTGYWRDTKDIDVFLLPKDVERALAVLDDRGYHTVTTAEHWLSKAFRDGYMIDLIYGTGNWLMPVDEEWLERSLEDEVLGVPVRIAPIEDIIWSKAYVAAHDRFDLADIMHLIQGVQGKLDWPRLMNRFGPHWRVLLAYVNFFQFIYPSDRHYIPDWVTSNLLQKYHNEMARPPMTLPICRGLLFDRASFVFDIKEKGYLDPRERLATKRGYLPEEVAEDRADADASIHDGRLD